MQGEPLAKALRACRRKVNKHRRAACERKARKRYGAVHKKTSNGRKASNDRRSK
jgi:ribosomal protein S21